MHSESGNLILVEILPAFPHLIYYRLWICHILFIVLRCEPSIRNLFRVFIMKQYWILSNAFSASVGMITWLICLLIGCVTYIDLHMLNHPCISGMKPSRLWQIIFFVCFSIWFTSIRLRIFASVLIRVWMHNFLLGCILVWFRYQGNAGLIEWVCKFRFYGIVWE